MDILIHKVRQGLKVTERFKIPRIIPILSFISPTPCKSQFCQTSRIFPEKNIFSTNQPDFLPDSLICILPDI